MQESEEEGWDQLSKGLDCKGDLDDSRTYGSPPTSVPSPAQLYPAGSPGTVAFVPLTEHRRLQKQHDALREQHQLLGQVTQVLVARQFSGDNTAKQPLDPRASMFLAAISASAPATAAQYNQQGDSTSTHGSSSNSDQDNLVQHMDSQPTDHVDIQGLMDEADEVHKTLSGQNSGISTTSRSTVHHVRPSPPPFSSGKAGCTSHPDSGYGTEHNRRGSLGDGGLEPVQEEQFAYPTCVDGGFSAVTKDSHNTFMTNEEQETGQESQGAGVAYDGGFDFMINDEGFSFRTPGFEDLDTFEFSLGS